MLKALPLLLNGAQIRRRVSLFVW